MKLATVVLTQELPDGLGFQLLRSDFESNQQPVDTCEQQFCFVRFDVLRSDGEMLRTAMMAPAPHDRE